MKRLLIFTDGTARPNPGPAAIGAIIKEEYGRSVAFISETIGRATNNEAEYRALIAALEKAIELGASHVEVRSDSEWMVRQIGGLYRVKKESIKPLYQRAKQLQSQLEGFTITHISNQENGEAHTLANGALG